MCTGHNHQRLLNSSCSFIDLQSCKGQSEISLTFKVPHRDFWAFKLQGILWTKNRKHYTNAYAWYKNSKIKTHCLVSAVFKSILHSQCYTSKTDHVKWMLMKYELTTDDLSSFCENARQSRTVWGGLRFSITDHQVWVHLAWVLHAEKHLKSPFWWECTSPACCPCI